MRVIGLDLDNTIVRYDDLIYDLALERGLIPRETPQNKMVIRDLLRAEDREREWTGIQGYIYGTGMEKATPFPGIKRFLEALPSLGLLPCIISHRSKTPYLGDNTDLHQAAMNWLREEGIAGEQCLVSQEHIFFELTKEAKYQRIRQMNCILFIDDLVEFLTGNLFPSEVRPVLFDPWRNVQEKQGYFRVESWDEALSFIQEL
jgi:hypothetical protein